jgi:hypothetical protein
MSGRTICWYAAALALYPFVWFEDHVELALAACVAVMALLVLA